MVVGYLVPRRYVKLAFFFRIDDRNTACIEHDAALQRVMIDLLADHTELFKQFSDNSNFKRWLTDTVFDATYQRGAVPPKAPPQTGASA